MFFYHTRISIIHITTLNWFVAGNLNIAAVRQEDIDDVKTWKCYISNRILNVDAGGSEMRIISSGQPPGEILYAARVFCWFMLNVTLDQLIVGGLIFAVTANVQKELLASLSHPFIP